jgi:hypothetical protein
VLDYRYGDSRQPLVRNPDYLLKEGRSLQGANVSGEMLRGDFLYVKWRIKTSGQVYEDTVDLRQRLPMDIDHHRIYFIVLAALRFLIPPEGAKRPEGKAAIGPSKYADLDIVQIYPNQPK